MRSLIEKYHLGMITLDHLIIGSLYTVDPEQPELVLSQLPADVLEKMLRFASEYVHGRLVTNYGLLPAQDQVMAARAWIEKTIRTGANKTA